MMVSSSGEGVCPARGAEASGLKCGRKRAGERMGRGQVAVAKGRGDSTEVGESTYPVKGDGNIIMQQTHISEICKWTTHPINDLLTILFFVSNISN